MLDIRVQVQLPTLPARAARQVPFALSRTINATLLDIQRAVRTNVSRDFTLRRRTFIERTVKIARGDFSTKTRLTGRVGIDPQRDFLAKFERGGTKRPRAGGSLAVPIEVRRTRAGVVSRALRVGALRIDHTGKGAHRTFVVRSGSTPGIYQRVGRGRNTRVRLLYAFKPSVPLPRSLRFVETARAVVNRRFAARFRREFRNAMATAR